MTYRGIIAYVEPDSIAGDIGLEPGDQLLAVNGQNIEDIIELSFALADENVELLIEKTNGEQEIFEIEKEYDETLGIEFESAVFDSVKNCANQCLFCFVDQMPSGLRESLYVKDDDYRLSFLYGNFITLTNINPSQLNRIFRLHLSPLYISVHTTTASLRETMLGNKHAGKIMDQLKQLVDNGIELHTQVVLCPGINDGAILEKTIQDLFTLHPQVLSLAIVPVGLSCYRETCYSLETFTAIEAEKVIDIVSKFQKKYRKQTGTSFVYLADEFYLAAEKAIPAYETYDDFPQLENGIGIVRNFLEEWKECIPEVATYTKPYYLDVVCGISAEKIMRPLLSALKIPNLHIRIVPVENKFFGSKITVSGLLTGQDIIETLSLLPGARNGVIIPGVALRKGEEVFLDDTSLEKVSKVLGVPVRAAYSAQNLRHLLEVWI